jgi:hypothetical protein
MREIHQTHPVGSFAKCKRCQKEPKHFRVLGRKINDTMRDLCLTKPLERHFLECCPCELKTELHSSLEGASMEWTRMYGVLDFKGQVLRLKRNAI